MKLSNGIKLEKVKVIVPAIVPFYVNCKILLLYYVCRSRFTFFGIFEPE